MTQITKDNDFHLFELSQELIRLEKGEKMFDFRKTKELYEGYNSVVDDLEQFLIHFLQENATWVLDQAIDQTPVNLGKQKSNWSITKVTHLSNDKLVFYLENNVDTTSDLEPEEMIENYKNWIDGYRIATISLAKLEERIPKKLDYAFARFLGRHGVL